MQKIALIVDDSRVARMTLKKLLIGYQFSVIELNSGESAIDYLNDPENTRPDVVFMDVVMGGMDGLTATQKIKENASLKDLPIIICTGNDTDEDRNRALTVGAVTALTKPPVAQALDDIIQKLNTLPPAPKTAAPAVDEAKLMATILAAVEQKLLPEIQQSVREIASDTTERLVVEQVKFQMQESTEILTAKIEDVSAHTAQQISMKIAQETTENLASVAVQSVIDDANITAQVTQFLSEKGEEWLADQEEDLGLQLSTQMDVLIPDIVTQHLNEKLESVVAPIIESKLTEFTLSQDTNALSKREEIEEVISAALHQYASTVVEPIVSGMVNKQISAQMLLEKEDEEIHSLIEQVDLLKKVTIGLSVVVVGLLIIAIV